VRGGEEEASLPFFEKRKTLMVHQRVMLGIPCYDERVMSDTMCSLQQSTSELTALGIETHTQVVNGDCFVDRARNTLLAVFIQTECTDLIMIDNDMGWESGSVPRILRHPVDLVAGLYPARRDQTTYMLRWHSIGKSARPDKRTGLLKVDAAPTGFMRISRKCAEIVLEALKDDWYEDETGQIPGGKAWPAFVEGPRDHKWWGEDFNFCHLWGKLGGHCWIDPWISCKHIGLKRWEGCFGTHKQKERLEILHKYRTNPEALSKELRALCAAEPEQHSLPLEAAE